MKNHFKIGIVIFFFSLFVFPASVFGYTISKESNFYIEKSFTENNRDMINGGLLYSSDRLNFYIDLDYWNSKNEEEKEAIEEKIIDLNNEFNRKIYPGITSVFGTEAPYGVNKDPKITLFFHEAKENVNGYVRNVDAFEKTINPYSNQRKIIYLNTDLIDNGYLKETLAHEFMHLITVNKKEIRYGINEDKWLNEARAEYVITLLGYNEGENKYIQSRINAFLEKPYTSLIEWNDTIYNYGVVNSFVHYLVDHYGAKILADSLNSEKIGIDSIEEALFKNGIIDDFSEIFTNWSIASYINDCVPEQKYCFKDKNFKNVYIIPFSNFLPFSGESTLYNGQTIENYSANWQRYVGGKEELSIKFSNPTQSKISVPYIVKTVSGENIVRFIPLSNNQEGEALISGIGKTVGYVTVIPSLVNDSNSQESQFYSITTRTFTKKDLEITNLGTKEFPFEIDKPLNQMNKEELLMLLIRVIIYLSVQGKLVI